MAVPLLKTVMLTLEAVVVEVIPQQHQEQAAQVS